jgi:myo-inositol-1(or 4)-monophosphatase
MSQSDLELIRDAALEAGERAASLLKDGKVKTWSKAGGSPVTNADLEVDGMLKRRLLEARPDYGWLSEETTDDMARLKARRAFVVDPIDGTIAYIKGRPWWAISIAVVEDGASITGVLNAPAVGELYEAEAGGGARLNGAGIAASGRAELEGGAILGDVRTLRHPDWPTPWPEDLRIESRNSVAYRMALVASGAFDAVVALSSKCDWDLAAADLIVREAGAVSTDHLGGAFVYNQPSPKKRSLICAPPELHRLILERVSHIELPR